MLQKEEMPKLEAVYQQFSEDYQLLIKQHGIRVPLVSLFGSSSRAPREQPMASYWYLSEVLKQPKGFPRLISYGELDHWNPPQQYMTWSRTMAGLFVWATIVLFGVLGLVFAVLHLLRLKRVVPREGLYLAGTAVFGYPVLITIASIPIFFIVRAEMKNSNSVDYFAFLFVAIIGAIAISAGIYFLRRYLSK